MMSRTLLAAALFIAAGTAPVFATPNEQPFSITAQPIVRSPVNGDPAALNVNPHMTAQQLAEADRQGPNTMDGNQPDRAEAGAGAR